MNILIAAAVEAEREAIARGIARLGTLQAGDAADHGRISVHAVGVGPAAAAAGTAFLLAAGDYDLVVSAGIGGGFPGRADIGTIVVADWLVAADLGAESPDGFLGLDELGFGNTRVQADPERVRCLVEALHAGGVEAAVGPVLTVTTATGTAATARELAARVPGAAAEAMEGWGVACAAAARGLPVLELRAISNAVGPRDRSAWRIKDALAALERASAILAEVLTQ